MRIEQEQHFVVYQGESPYYKIISGPYWDFDEAYDALRVVQRKAMFEHRYSVLAQTVILNLN